MFFTVSVHIRIEETSKIKIYDNIGAVVPLKYLKDVIHKYEKGEHFFLRIELMKTDGEEDFNGHAFVSMKVGINAKNIEQKLNISYFLLEFFSGTEKISH